MYPNPQDALPLPPRPDLEQLKKRAKDLVKACKSGDADALHEWAAGWVNTLLQLSGVALTQHLPVRKERWTQQLAEFASDKMTHPEGTKCALSDAQFVVARALGFSSWSRLSELVKGVAQAGSRLAGFESAADAIVAGDAAALTELLRNDPTLPRARSTREHRATLLHYVSANGVEGYRQKTPANAVHMAEILLNAGADVDATADVYGGGATTLGLTATSVQPERAGVQEALMQLLLDRGAAIDGPGAAGNRHSAVCGCLANGRGLAAEFLAEHGARLDLEGAAGTGRLDVVKSFFNQDGGLISGARKAQMEAGFMWACEYGHTGVVEFLLGKGVDVGLQVGGFTGLHWAAHGANLDAVKLLLKRNAPLDARNSYGGTPLEQALWSSVNSGLDVDFVPVIECLIAAGARVGPEWSTGIQRIDEVLRRHQGKM